MSGVRSTYTGNVATIMVSNEAKLNALTTAMLSELETQFTSLEANEDVRVVILTGAGPKAFCCGADISEWGSLGPRDFARFWVRNGHRIFDRIARFSKPTIGAINGHAFGGGLELAACCDIRVLSHRATLALPEAKVGIVPGWSGTQRLTRLLPEPVIKEMALFGRRISAERALAMGFAAELSGDVVAEAYSIAASLIDASPRANEIAKAMIHGAVGEDSAATIEALGSAAAAATGDRDEGVAAFLEKRSPKFDGQ